MATAMTASRHLALGLGETDLVAMYRTMRLARLLDQRMWQMNRIGRAPFVISTGGHEGAEVGAAWAIDRRRDWIRPYYRDLALCLALGLTALEAFLGLFAKAEDPASGGRQMPGHFSDAGRRIFTCSSPVGTQFPQGVGLALAARTLGTGAVAWTFGGEGSTSTGDWHEAMNFASVHKLPWVCVIENNGYAISETAAKQMVVKNVADRAVAYGMPGVTVDGMDALAAYEAARDARARAARGDGPTLLEYRVYRYMPHTSDDDDRKYRTREEIAEWRRRDPIDRFAEVLDAAGIDLARRAAIDAALQAEVDAALDEAAARADPRPEDGDRHVYATRLVEGLRG